ncbi:hypothetical protein DL93DRAFT_2164691 [Clavulina sp. PMI_390]|nr:hypothetical protein DL93DRAFT_2164691 [Clavulina sp. PMI_390]
MPGSSTRVGGSSSGQPNSRQIHQRRREVEHLPAFDIPGDAQEYDRIALEQGIGHLDFTFENSNTDTHSRGTGTPGRDHDRDEEEEDFGYRRRRKFAQEDDESVELGRHGHGRDGAYSPTGELSISHSFVRLGGHGAFDHTDVSFTDHDHTYSPHHPQSRHKPQLQKQHQHEHRPPTHEQEDGDETMLRGQETLSTAQHHASAITLGAGLIGPGGPGFNSRTPSRSNISAREFDPERKLPDLLATARIGLSMFDDEDGEGDMTFRHQKAPSKTTPPFPPVTKRSSATSVKPELFAPSFASADPIIVDDTAELELAVESGRLQYDAGPAPVARAPRQQYNLDDNAASDPEPELSESSSSLTRASQTHSPPPIQQRGRDAPVRPSSAVGILKDALGGEVSPRRSRGVQDHYSSARGARMASNDVDREKRAAAASARRRQQQIVEDSYDELEDVSGHPARGTVAAARLPDMTGLTSAVETPAKPRRKYRRARDHAADVTVVRETVDNLAFKIRELETENVTSHRRVRELEHSLEEYKVDVVRERTRVEAELHRQQTRGARPAANARDYKGKGKGKQLVDEEPEVPLSKVDRRALEARYHEAVKAKRDLERVVDDLHSQLASMNQRLEEYKLTVEELQHQREDDEQQILARAGEISNLRGEVDRLAQEVRRLRGVIESKLHERQLRPSSAPALETRRRVSIRDRVAAPYPPQSDDENDELESQLEQTQIIHEDDTLQAGEVEREQDPVRWAQSIPRRRDHDRLSTVDEVSEPPSSVPIPHNRPASRFSNRHPPRQYARSDQEHSEVDEEANDWGREFHTTPATAGSSRPARKFEDISEIDLTANFDRRSNLSYAESHASDATPLPVASSHPRAYFQPSQQRPSSRAGPSHAPMPPSHKNTRPVSPSEAFPRIRSSKTEHLFFSLPDHDERTCRTCRHDLDHPAPSNSSRRHRKEDGRDSAEGQKRMLHAATEMLDDVRKGKPVDDDAIPPQAVMARLLRELEDDFMHYKSTYIELADQYGAMDPASNPLKRNALADHLREVIDILETKGDQIAALYDVLKLRKGAHEVVDGVRAERQRELKGKARTRV